MAAKDEEKGDLYGVLGLKKECTAAELRNAYKKLALRWHPDRCSASGSSKSVEEAKKKFQAIQEAYSVLSDDNKRFMYDIGVYDSDDAENGMGDFLNEMAAMMSQTKPNDKGEESFSELKELFEEMFQTDIDAFNSSFDTAQSSSCSSSLFSTTSYTYNGGETSNNNTNKRNSKDMSGSGSTNMEDACRFDAHFQGFCMGVEQMENTSRRSKRVGKVAGREGSRRRRRSGRKHKLSTGHHVPSGGDHSTISAWM